MNVRFALSALLTLLLLGPSAGFAKKKAEEKAEETPETKLTASTFAGLGFRGIGPAFASGRIGDLAVDPENPKVYYVAVASGGVWKTTNAGTTFEPIFDSQGSYSIGCVTIDPNDSNVVWVGTGENNSQRSVGYGDGVYKSLDGGKSWNKVGLENSEHIGKIVVDPRDSNVVYVAAQGPLWASGGDRGLYKTTDGGETWEKVLEIDEHTGVSDLVYDPRDPDVLYASAYQRRRRVWTLVNGGPGSALYKSTDAGANWRKVHSGLPSVELGRIGLAIAPSNPDVVYAIVEAAQDEGGFFRSTNRGESWEKRSGYVSGSPQYYQEIVVDPHDADRVYSNDTFVQVTEDGGKTWEWLPEWSKHVDNHAIWIDPDDTDHLLMGCDGGVYETFDRGANWRFMANLPVTQFYKLALDNDLPFYNVYGGTQDNFTLGGPSRTLSAHGIVNSDWYVTLGGDGFQAAVDPTDPNIVYSQLQYGEIVRTDLSSGETVGIKPLPEPGEPALRWNWDSPLIISPHSHTRLYFASNVIYRSDDRGDSWRPVSPDLTRQSDRNAMEVMGEVWSIDAVSKNRSTSFYGNIVSLSESPFVEGLLYAGTDDGLIQVSENGGEQWRKVESVAGVPERTYVNDLAASRHDADTVYAAFNNHKSGDFKPYVLKSTDRGATWTSITGDLPERGSAYSLAEDPTDPEILFAGTEFGVYFTLDGGERWIELTSGVPTVAVRDLAVHEREGDLVLGTFGRGFYVLDDYTPLRHVTEEKLEEEALLFPVRDALMYVPRMPLGLPGKSFQGDAYYAAPNPPYGAIFTYYLGEGYETLQDKRRAEEKEKREAGEAISYPDWDDLRAETREEAPAVILTVRDADGRVVRHLEGPVAKGFHRVAWDFRYPPTEPVELEPWSPPHQFADPPTGPLAAPGTYTVELAKRIDGEPSSIHEPLSFEIEPLGTAGINEVDAAELVAFQKKVAELQRAVWGAGEVVGATDSRLAHLKKAIDLTPGAGEDLGQRVRELEDRLADLNVELFGDPVIAGASEPTPPSIFERVGRVIQNFLTSTGDPTETQRHQYEVAGEAFEGVLGELRQLVETDLEALEADAEAAGAPWTPGRVPTWQRE